uniref:Uncharacterized protein n=1 Tax=Globodera rostochiensis TaxID=31243 RepID=A0A914I9W3_GLORO
MPLLDAEYDKQTRIFKYDSIEYHVQSEPQKQARKIKCKLSRNMFLSHNPARRNAYETEVKAASSNWIYWMCIDYQRCSLEKGCDQKISRKPIDPHHGVNAGGLSTGVILAISFGSLALLIICGAIAVLIIYKFCPTVFGRKASKRGSSNKSSFASAHRTTMMNQAYSAISTYFRTRRNKTKKVSASAKPNEPTKYRPASSKPSVFSVASKPMKTKFPSSATPKHQSNYPPSDGTYSQFQRKR